MGAKQLILRKRSRNPRSRQTAFISTFIPTVAGLIYLLWLYRGSVQLGTKSLKPKTGFVEANSVDWNSIEPSEQLRWVSCLEAFQCARLTVPMDYEPPPEIIKSYPKVHIALMMLPGINHHLPRSFSKSPLLINPGGPGGSGVQMVQGWASRVRAMVGDEQDVIGFDPRGIGSSSPRLDCFSFESAKTSSEDYSLQVKLNRMVWDAAGRYLRVVDFKNDNDLVNLDDRNEALAKLCKSKDDIYGQKSILRHANSVHVVKDMASILDAWGSWISSDSPNSVPQASSVKLDFWGFSYGTLLGSTFAALYPDRIGRVVLDGVMDVDMYLRYAWEDHIQDLDKVFESFFQHCSSAKSLCQLYRPGNYVSDIKRRFHDIMKRLERRSVKYVDPFTLMPTVITYERVKEYIFDATMRPMDKFPDLAQTVNAIGNGNYTTIAEKIKSDVSLDSESLCTANQPPQDIPEIARAVVCSDKSSRMNESLSDLKKIYNNLSEHSYFADVWMTQMAGCRHWNVSAAGPPLPFTTSQSNKKREQINTSFPLLFVSNTADPVGPVKGGLNMALRFRDAGFIEQKSEGHCSTSVLSRCTVAKVRAYSRDGVVPLAPDVKTSEWTRCEPDEAPWKPFGSEATTREKKTGEDAVLKNWIEMQKIASGWGSFRW